IRGILFCQPKSMRPLNIHPQNVPSPRICGSAALSEGGYWKGSASEGGEQLLIFSVASVMVRPEILSWEWTAYYTTCDDITLSLDAKWAHERNITLPGKCEQPTTIDQIQFSALSRTGIITFQNRNCSPPSEAEPFQSPPSLSAADPQMRGEDRKSTRLNSSH